ncbi:MAG: IS6 family transposase, partial [Actinomycetota bacterium]|nr:IS6 family transposase [Actinomycetota bacterium]
MYLRYVLTYRNVEKLLAELRTQVDQVTIYRWGAAIRPATDRCGGPCRHVPGGRWFVDETYVKSRGGG